MSRALFVSDIHIHAANDPKAGLFAHFLEECASRSLSHLFLVGDIFDLWIADREYFRSTYKTVIDQIVTLKKKGVEIFYFEGNHDLDLKIYWQQELGVKVFEGPTYFDLLGRTIRVEHGDEMDPEDKGYLFLRWLLRTPAVKELGRKLPNPAVKFIGEKASGASREYTSHIKTVSDEDVRAKFRRHVERVYNEKPFDILVSGHVHVEQEETFSPAGKPVHAFNLGTWLKRPLALEVTTDTAKLVSIADWIQG